jgi:hypothetical protein
MGEHFTRNTLETTAWCAKCKRETLHRVDHPVAGGKGGGRLGPCLECMGFKIGLYLFAEQPKCYHCDAPFPETSRVEAFGLSVVLACPSCGLLTPCQFEEKLTKAQRERRKQAEQDRRNPKLF